MLAAAAAMNQVMWSSAGIVGPALGGIIVSHFGLTWAYGLDVASYAVAFIFASMLRSQRPVRDPELEVEGGLTAVLAGLHYLRGRRILQSTFTIDVVAMVFGMPRVLFPALAVEQFHRGPEAVGWMFAAVAAGVLIGALTSGWVGRVRRHGLAITLAVTVWGLAVTAFGLVGDRFLDRARVPGIGRRCRCGLGRVPGDDPTVDGSGRVARTTRGVQHLRRCRWAGWVTSKAASSRRSSHPRFRSCRAVCYVWSASR